MKHKWHDEIVAWAGGAEIEWLWSGEWEDCDEPRWHTDYEYRIKPQPSRSEKQYLLNKQHLEKPEKGDIWREMFVPYFIVDAVTEKYIVVFDKTISTNGGYTFDNTKPKLMTMNELKEAVTYSTMRDKFVADVTCYPGVQDEV